MPTMRPQVWPERTAAPAKSTISQKTEPITTGYVVSDRGVELVADGLLELAAEGAEEVLVDHDLLRGVGLTDEQPVGVGRALGRRVRLVRPEVGDEEVAADDEDQHAGDQAEAGELLLALGLLAPLLGLRQHVAGGAAGGMKGNRHIRYDRPTPLANLHLTLLDKVGVHLDSFADSTGKLDELFPLSI